jgi:hypothetical protein
MGEEASMEHHEVDFLYFITAQANVPSILAHGLLSHNRAKHVQVADISLASVQDIRATKRVPGGRRLHDYACLYFCARNPMLYKRCQEMRDELCVLVFAHEVLDLPGVVIADHNAAADVAGFGPYPIGLEAVDKDLTFAEWWTHADPQEKDRHRKRMCAEVLVPNLVDSSFIQRALVASPAAKRQLDSLAFELTVDIDAFTFFL